MFDYILRYMAEYHRAPLIREVQLGCQIVSYKSAVDRLNALEHKGFIRRTPNKHRGIRIAHRRAASLVSVPQPVSAPSLEGVA